MSARDQGRFSGTASDFNPAALLDGARLTPDGRVEEVRSQAIGTTAAESDFLRLEAGPFTGRATEVRDGEIAGVLNPYLLPDRDTDFPERIAGWFGAGSVPSGDQESGRPPRRR